MTKVLTNQSFKRPHPLLSISVVTILIFLPDPLPSIPFFAMRSPFNFSSTLFKYLWGYDYMPKGLLKSAYEIMAFLCLTIVLKIKQHSQQGLTALCICHVSSVSSYFLLLYRHSTHTIPGMNGIFSTFWPLHPLPGMFFSNSSSS